MNANWYDIREVRETDAGVVAAHRFDASWGDEARCIELRGRYSEWLVPLIHSSSYVGRLAVADGQVIAGAGAVLLEWGATWADPNPVKARLVNVFTADAFRRRGVAKHLVGEVIAALRARGIISVSLASADGAERLYEGLGFERRPNEFALRYR